MAWKSIIHQNTYGQFQGRDFRVFFGGAKYVCIYIHTMGGSPGELDLSEELVT